MLLMRNPWGETTYNKSWNGNDTRWTDQTVSQVPFNIDPRQAQNTGTFVFPIEGLIDAECFTDVQIGYQRAKEGYAFTWYDAEDQPKTNGYLDNVGESQLKNFYFTPSSSSGDIYITVETFPMGTVHSACTSGTFKYGPSSFEVDYPVIYFDVAKNGSRSEIAYEFYIETFHVPMVLKEGSYKSGHTYKIQVYVEWLNSPVRDYTVGIYSK